MGEHAHPDPPQLVVGTDGTTTALRAVAWAATEAQLRGLPLRIVHAAPYAASADPPGRRRAAAILARAYTVAHQHEPTITACTAQLDERPVPALVAASETAELLVLGMIEQRLGEVIIGSVAFAVTAHARCPVTVVRGTRRTPGMACPVLLGVADTSTDAAAVTVAFADAQRHGTGLVVLHARHGTLRDRISGADPDTAPTATAHTATAHTATAHTVHQDLAPWHARYPSVPVEVRIVHGAPADELLQAATAARLIIVATRGRGAPTGAVLGSTSRTLLRYSPCPVTVVHRDALIQAPTPPAPTAAEADPHDRAQLW